MKYSYEHRLESVKMVLEQGYSYNAVVQLKGGNVKSLRHWVGHYQREGVSGLCKKNNTYDSTFKQSVIRYLEANDVSLFSATIKFGVPDERLVRSWLHIYQKDGISGLCGSNRDIDKPMKSSKKKQHTSVPNEDLHRELELLRAENAYLKKLQALVQERIARENGNELSPLKN